MKKLLLGLLLFVAACSDPIVSGVVIDKRYEPPRTYVRTVMKPIFGFKGQVSYFPVTETVYDDEDFVLVVRGKTKKGEIKARNFYVSKQTYSLYKVGSSWPIKQNTKFKLEVRDIPVK